MAWPTSIVRALIFNEKIRRDGETSKLDRERWYNLSDVFEPPLVRKGELSNSTLVNLQSWKTGKTSGKFLALKKSWSGELPLAFLN